MAKNGSIHLVPFSLSWSTWIFHRHDLNWKNVVHFALKIGRLLPIISANNYMQNLQWRFSEVNQMVKQAVSFGHALPKKRPGWSLAFTALKFFHAIYDIWRIRNLVWYIGKCAAILKFGAIRIPKMKNLRYVASQECILSVSVRLCCRTWLPFLGFVVYSHYLGLEKWIPIFWASMAVEEVCILMARALTRRETLTLELSSLTLVWTCIVGPCSEHQPIWDSA